MKRYRRIILGFVGLACMVIPIVIGAASLMETSRRTEVLTVAFSSAAAGAILTNLVKDIRSRK
ncbi:MAG: hypothetical protein L0213_10340 [Candidatus Dadabacteria bacterium]|nr:hypothetical protein [Candidatus Dadabacteria bacterium]